jgi:hypothetical protein
MPYLPRGEYRPTLDEIREASRAIREHGFHDHLGGWHAPWTEADHRQRAGIEAAPVEIPVVSPVELFGEAAERRGHG